MSEEVERPAVEEFISRDTLADCLRKFAGKDIVELSPSDEIVVEPATRKVESSTSSVYRLKVAFRVAGKNVTQNKSLVLKRLPQVPFQQEIVQKGGLFRREVFFFDKALPYMKMIGGRRMGPPIPDCFHAVSDDEENLIVLEDLFEEGYKSSNYPLSHSEVLEHCLMVMRRLGQLHGFSYAAERTLTRKSMGWLGMEPSLKEDLLFYETSEGGEQEPSYVYGMFLESINMALDLADEVSQKAGAAAASGELASILKGAWSIVCQLIRGSANPSNVLCHGDCWMNNVVFRYDSTGGKERLVDAKFLDFQLSRYGHPCLDIAYFLYLSTSKTIRRKHMNEILLAYFNSLVDTLTFLGKGAPPITLAELRHDLLFKYKPFGIIMAFVLKPILSLDPQFVSERSTENAKEEEESETPKKLEGYDAVKKCYETVSEYKDGLIDVLEEMFELMLPVSS